MNALIKHWQGFQVSQMDQFVLEMKELVLRQRKEVERTFLGLDTEYQVKSEFAHKIVPFQDYSKKKKEDKEKTRKSFHSIAVDPDRMKLLSKFRPRPPLVSRLDLSSQKTSNERQVTNEEFQVLEELGYVSQAEMNGIVAKVRNILAEEGIRDGFNNDFLVKSVSQGMPHIVSKRNNGGYVCDENCPAFRRKKLCAHLFAVAFKEGKIDTFLSWFLQRYPAQENINLTTLSCDKVNKNAGKKGPTRQRTQRKRTKSPTGLEMADSRTMEGEAGIGATQYTSQILGNNRIRLRKLPGQQKYKPVDPVTRGPFFLKSIKGKISICAGCQSDISVPPKHGIAQPTVEDTKYCLGHYEAYYYPNKMTGEWMMTKGNKHYHLCDACIVPRNPYFGDRDVTELYVDVGVEIDQDLRGLIDKRFSKRI